MPEPSGSDGTSYSSYLRPQHPPAFNSVSYNDPFYHDVHHLLRCTTEGAVTVNDLTSPLKRVANNVFSFHPPANKGDENSGVEVGSPRDCEQLYAEDKMAQPAEMPPFRYNSDRDIVSLASKEDEESFESTCMFIRSPAFWITAAKQQVHRDADGVHEWRVAGLVAAVQHSPLCSEIEDPDERRYWASSKAHEAIVHALTRLASAWTQCGTWLGLCMLNSRFSRLCVLNRGIIRSLRHSYATAEVEEINIALEVPDDVLAHCPDFRVSYSTLVEVDYVDPTLLFCHDLVASYDFGGVPFLDLTTGRYTLNDASMKTLWTTFERAINVLRKLPWGQPPEHLARCDPPSADFREYVTQLLYTSIRAPTPDGIFPETEHSATVIGTRRPSCGSQCPSTNEGQLPGALPNGRSQHLALHSASHEAIPMVVVSQHSPRVSRFELGSASHSEVKPSSSLHHGANVSNWATNGADTPAFMQSPQPSHRGEKSPPRALDRYITRGPDGRFGAITHLRAAIADRTPTTTHGVVKDAFAKLQAADNSRPATRQEKEARISKWASAIETPKHIEPPSTRGDDIRTPPERIIMVRFVSSEEMDRLLDLRSGTGTLADYEQGIDAPSCMGCCCM